MKSYISFLIICLAFSLGVEAKNLKELNRFTPENFELLDVEIGFGHMIVPAGLGGAVLYDLSEPLIPAYRATMSVGEFRFGRTYNWDLTSKIAVGTGREQGIAIYDIKDKRRVQKLTVYNPNSFSLPGISGTISCEDVELYNNYALIAAHSHGLLIFDLSEPSNPVYVNRVVTENAVSLAVGDDIVYLADGDGGLKLISIVDIKSPRILSSHNTTGSSRDVRFADGFVFLAVGAEGVDVFNAANPFDVYFVDNGKTAGFASRVAVNGSRVAASAWSRLDVFEFDGVSLELSGYKNTGGRVMAVGSPGGDLFYSAEWQLFRVFQYGQINDPDIDLSSRVLDFPQLQPGASDTLNLTIENNGGSPLNILAYGLTSDEFYLEPQETAFAPGEHKTVDVIYQANSTRGGGSLEILSNDPDEQSVIVTLNGNSSRNAAVGKVAPNFSLNAVANASGTVTLSAYRGRVVVLALFASW